jgi:hypothetical protein
MEIRAEMKGKDQRANRFALRFYAGHKGNETPRSVIIGSREFKINRILDRSRVCDKRTGKTSDVFTCEMEGQKVRITVRESGIFEIAYLKS